MMDPQDEAALHWTLQDLGRIVDGIGSLQLVLLLAGQYPELFRKLNRGFNDYYDYVNDRLIFSTLDNSDEK